MSVEETSGIVASELAREAQAWSEVAVDRKGDNEAE